MSMGKRLLSLLLALCMLWSVIGTSVLAAPEETVIPLEASRLSEDTLPEGNLIYFGSASASLPEEAAVYSVPIYREGDVSGEAAVEIHSIDITALYGEDYELVTDEAEIIGGDETILECYSRNAAALSETEAAEAVEQEEQEATEDSEEAAAEDIEAAEDSEVSEDSENAEIDTADDAESEPETDNVSEEPDDGYVSLAELKQQKTGLPTREVKQGEPQSLLDSVMDEMVPDVMNEMEASAKLKVTFAPGETEKVLEFRILDDRKAEGDEGFSLLLTNPENAQVYMVTSLAVTICDDEPAEHSEVSFTKAKYKSEDGKAVVKVKRKGAEYSVADMSIRSVEDTAKAGENYREINEIVAFAPYETEKEIEIPVAGKGEFELVLSDFKACQEGKITRATVEANEEEGVLLLAADTDENARSFQITIEGRSYTVEYNWGDAKGKIMDEAYEPALQVGEYYFPSDPEHGGIFSYAHWDGDKPGGTRTSHYQEESTTDMSKNFGKLYYYYWVTGKKGKVWTETANAVPAVYYRYVAPDWAMTVDDYGGQRSRFRLASEKSANAYDITSDSTGKFGRTRDKSIIEIGKDTSKNSNSTFDMFVYSIDQEKNKTPKSYLNFYGAAAMFKRYDVSMEAPTGLTYQTPTGLTEAIEPSQVTVKCGAQMLYQHESRAIFVNPDVNESSLVFSVGNSHVNDHDGKFGSIKGYRLTVGTGGENAATLNYPEDFVSFLNKQKNNVTGCIDYSASTVEKEIALINQSLDTIPVDSYFIDWIENSQVSTTDDSDGPGYKQLIKFKPIIDYNEVEVTVLEPTGGKGHFNNPALAQGQTAAFHAGDLLDLSATAEDAANDRVMGYEVSTDGGVHFDTVTSETTLFLESFQSYMIRPVIAGNDNRIEIQFANSEAMRNLEIVDTIPAADLFDNDQLRGRTILNINPEEKTVEKKMQPVVGKDYPIKIRVTGKPAENGYVYRPVVTDALTGSSYNTQIYYLNARNRKEDNILRVSVEKVKESELQTWNISGDIASAIAPIRSDGLELKNLPVVNTTVMMGSGQNSDGAVLIASAQTDETGAYTIMDVTARAGDRIPLLLSNGLTNGQVTELVLPASGNGKNTANVGRSLIGYPTGIPKVIDITYSYDKLANNQSNDNTQNSVNIYDDTFHITAYAETAGREISHAVFTVYTPQGVRTEFTAYPDGGDVGKFTVTIPKMADELHKGDRVSVRLVDKEKAKFDIGGESGAGSANIEYPDVDTGLVFYTENVLRVPQFYEAEAAPTVNIPVVGAVGGSASSGLLTFSRTDWDAQKSGYTLDINISGSYASSAASSKDKLKVLNNYKAAVQKDDTIVNAKAENIMLEARREALDDTYGDLPSVLVPEEDWETNLNDQIEKNNKLLDDLGENNNAKNMRMGMTKSKSLSVSANIMLSLEFIYSPVQQEYVLCYYGITLGGTFTFNKTFYTAISFVPCFFNLNGTIQGSLALGEARPEGKKAYTAGEFEGLAGNIAQVMNYGDTDVDFDLMFKLTGQVGVGICGIFSAQGYVSLKLQLDLGRYTGDTRTGFLFGSEGGISISILVGTININMYSAQVGFGSLSGRTSYSFFGGLIGDDTTRSARLMALSEDENEKVLSVDENGNAVTYRNTDTGTEDMSSFGQYGGRRLRASLEPISKTELLSPAAEHTNPKLTQLEDGKKFLTFLGNGGDGHQALFYSVFDGGQWSEPLQVADDGTADGMPDVLNMGSKVIIAWVDANRAFTDADTAVDKLKTMEISTAAYDVNTGEMSQERTLVTDAYCNLAPQLSAAGNTIYCSYMKRDLHDVENEEELLDMEGIYSTMAYVKYQIDSAELTEEEAFVTLPHPSIEDPLVFDYHMESVEAGGETYMVSAYTIDEDEDLQTGEDRSMWLQLSRLSGDSVQDYYPMQVEKEGSASGSPQLSKLDGKLYLTYITGGNTFKLLDVSNLLDSLFVAKEKEEPTTEDETPDPADVSVYRNANKDDPDWYKKTAAALGITEEAYQSTVYEELYQGDFTTDSTGFRQRDSAGGASAQYVLTSNGKDLYLFFTDVSSTDNGTYSTGRELYGMRYHCEEENEEAEEPGGFSAASQITNYNKVIDEIDICMTENNEISLVSNYYEQSIAPDGGIQFSDNALVELEFRPASSVEINPSSVKTGNLIVGQSTLIEFEVKNSGMLPANGYEYKIVRRIAGSDTIIAEGQSDTILYPGETETLSAEFTPTGEGMNAETEILFYVSEKGAAISSPASLKVPYESVLRFTDSEIVWKDGTPAVTAELKNLGRKPSEPVSGTLYAIDGEGNKKADYGTFEIPALASGETQQIELSFTPKVADFSELGIIDLKLAVSNGKETLENTALTLSSVSPMLAEINGGAESITVKKGGSAALTTVAAPWNSIAGTVKYYSADNSIASVDETGMVTGNETGDTTIYAYYPQSGVTDSIDVSVTSGSSGGSSGGGGGSSRCKVSFVSNGGSAVDSITVNRGSAIQEPAQPTREGFIFAGWYTDKNLVNRYDFSAPVTQNLTLYAKWESEPKQPDQADRFIDVAPDAWYAASVDYVAANGIMQGVGENRFDPDGSLTRAMLVTILHRLEGVPATEAQSVFNDVAQDSYYAQAVAWAYENGIVKGVSETEFAPDDNITREQIAAMLYRYSQYKGYDVNIGENTNILSYADAGEISEYAIPAMCYAVSSDLMYGRTESTLNPQETTTRAEAATLLQRYLGLYQNKG